MNTTISNVWETGVSVLSPWKLPIAISVFLAVGLVQYLRRPAVPQYGGALSFSRILSLVRLARYGREEYLRAYAEDPMMYIPRGDTWAIIAHPSYMDELNRAPDDVLSFMDAASDLIQLRYTFGPKLADNPWHIKVITNQLTRNLANTFPEVHDETKVAITELLGTNTNEWLTLNNTTFIQQVVARASNRIFIGLPICRDKEWLALNISGAMECIKVAFFINIFPPILRPIVGRMVSQADKRAEAASKVAGAYIEERIAQNEADRPNDFISWLLTYAPPDEQNAKDITSRIVATNFAAIHTSTMNVTHAIYWLLARPQYLEPIRLEILEVTERVGWTKDAIGTMPKLDSFMKESMRMCPVGTTVMTRKALKPFTFSNGVQIPTGGVVGAHLYATHQDEKNYPNPEVFDGFRFVEPPRSEDAESAPKSKKTMYTTSQTYLPFGHGKHACPGRFFASMEVKLIVAYLIVEYEMKWSEEIYGTREMGEKATGDEEEGYRPPDVWFAGSLSPNTKAKIMFRKRVVE